MTKTVKLNRLYDHKLPMGVLGVSLCPDDPQPVDVQSDEVQPEDVSPQDSSAGELVIAAACMDGVYRLSLANGEYEKLYSHQSYASSVHWLKNDRLLSAGYDGAVRWFDLPSAKLEREASLHQFWSWDMAVTRDQSLLASVTGQYLAGSYKYEPQPEREPSLWIVEIDSGEVVHRLPHVPSVQAVDFSDDGRFVAAGNLMGEVRVFEVATGELKASWTTPDFTSWGIIKSHCYLGGIFALKFTPDGQHILVAGMGQMRDPMAGNGKQLWQKWKWSGGTPEKVDQTHDGEAGEGLMETLAIHPSGDYFAMGGRLRGGDWNVALFDMNEGKRVAILKTGYRVTEACFNRAGDRLILVGAQGQSKRNKRGNIPPFGRTEVYEVAIA